MITMILGGFWHGAAWQFLLWGTYHGILLALGHALPQREARGALDRAARTVVTFHLVLAGWFLFRVEHLSDVGLLLGSAPGAALVQSPADLMSALAVLAGFAAVHAWRHARPVDLLRNGQPLLAQVAVVSLAVAVLVLFGAPSASFLYFQF